MTAPARVLDHIDRKAAEHETTADRVLSRDMARETVDARQAAIRELSQMVKPNGRLPTVREMARWFNVEPSTVARIVR